MADRTITVDLIGRDKSLSSSLDKSGRSAEKSSRTLSALGKVAGGALKVGMVAGAVGVAAVGKFMVDGVKSAASYQKLLLKTAAVIKSTGNAAHISVSSVKNMASELESMSGVDEELIVNSQNVLATFTGIRNVGKNRIFDQATKSALDMSVALGTDLQGASIQVGKALNDPIKGITALSRVGVSFTADQKKVIAQMVKTGDTVGAQKVILAELNKEFGGAAKAAGSGFSGSLARAKDAVDDAGREIGTALLPKLTDLVNRFTKDLPGAIAATKSAWKDFASAYNGSKLDSSSASDLGGALRVLTEQLHSNKGGFDDAGASSDGFKSKLGEIPAAFVDVASASVSAWNHIKNGFQEAGLKIQQKGQETANGVSRAFGHLPGALGRHFDDIVAKNRRAMDDIQTKLNHVNANQLRTKISDIDLQLSQLGRKKVTPKISADISRLTAARKAAQHQLDLLHDVRINVTTVFKQVGKQPGSYGQGLGVLAGHRAKGGRVEQNKVYEVGEQGREFFMPDQNGTIIPNESTPRTNSGTPWSGGAGGGVTVNVYVQGNALASAGQIREAVVQAFVQAPAGSKKLPRRAVA